MKNLLTLGVLLLATPLAAQPVEFHAYQKGGHGFGTGRPGTTTPLMLDQFRLWIETNGWLAK